MFLLRAWEDFTRPAGHAQHATSPPLTLTVAAAPSGGNWEASPARSMGPTPAQQAAQFSLMAVVMQNRKNHAD